VVGSDADCWLVVGSRSDVSLADELGCPGLIGDSEVCGIWLVDWYDCDVWFVT
jgi:hypothetical protein